VLEAFESGVVERVDDKLAHSRNVARGRKNSAVTRYW
ncbi:MAG: hypothetical protein QOF88_2188, partial [Mycobacterium sp.]|nr:hypothetical protein [Mycobacterium sp.]